MTTTLAEKISELEAELNGATVAADRQRQRAKEAEAVCDHLRAELELCRGELRSHEGVAEFGHTRWFLGIVEQRDRLQAELDEARVTIEDLRHDQSTQETLKEALRATIAQQAETIETLRGALRQLVAEPRDGGGLQVSGGVAAFATIALDETTPERIATAKDSGDDAVPAPPIPSDGTPYRKGN